VALNGANEAMRSVEFSQDYTLTGTGTDSDTSVSITYNELYLGI
jgi:hypothetical protein